MKAEKLSARTREGMQSALGTLMHTRMDAVASKEELQRHMDTLVNNSAQENGVCQMMLRSGPLCPG